jgi:phage terminase large subunit-like protein
MLPPKAAVDLMSQDEILRVLAKKKELTSLVEADPVHFFSPAPTGGQRQFMTYTDPFVQGRFFFAANKTGKTTGGAIVSGEFGEGQPLWGLPGREVSPWLSKRPKRMCFFAEDFATHEEAIVPTYASWMKKYIHDIVKGPSGNISRVIHKNGTVIYLRTYDQGYEKAEGKDYDLVWCDEPPPRDIYTAIFRGLVATKGLLLITATLLSETWLYDEMQQPFVKIFEATMYDNPWLDDSARANFAAMLSEEERAIRIFGKPSNLSGSIYPMLSERYPYVIEQMEPPWNPVSDKPWPVVLGIDPHERKPVFAQWGYVTPNDSILWFDWDLIPSLSISSVFQRLKKREATHKAPTTVVIIDPNRGAARQLDGKSWADAFSEHEYQVILGNDDLSHGHFVMREMLTAPPRMAWMESCRGKDGPLFQLQRYTWEDWSRGTRFERGVKEKPKEKYKDFPDICRYVAVALYDQVISFESLLFGDENIDIIGEEFGGRNAYIN